MKNTVMCVLMLSMSCTGEDSYPSNYPSAEETKYVLPFPVGRKYTCSQSTGHTGSFKFAYDFQMAIGTVITAARAGTVVYVVESWSDGYYDMNKTNLIVIQHKDGEYSRYIHLTYNGALVQVGQQVDVGDTVALSGNTGISLEPHLHFDITHSNLGPFDQTYQVTFANSIPQDGLLRPGVVYEAEAYDKTRFR